MPHSSEMVVSSSRTPTLHNAPSTIWSYNQSLQTTQPIYHHTNVNLDPETARTTSRFSTSTISTTSENLDEIVRATGGSSAQLDKMETNTKPAKTITEPTKSCLPFALNPTQTIIAAASIHLTSQMGEPTWLLVVPPQRKMAIGSLFHIRMVDGRLSKFTFKARARDEDFHDRIVIRAVPINVESPKEILLIIEDRWFRKSFTETITSWWWC
ncbi:hypothetical protein BC629DRAFT_1435736 [Irpex lacteus]|nr:hypothetical protein BC629DRAFT_1435736 [Irpex lacteus]